MFIYGLIDPRTGCLRYIGQAEDVWTRYSGHIRENKRTHKSRWIRGLVKLGLRPELAIIEETDRPDDAERFWIASLRAAGAQLLNLTDGGNRLCFTPEVRAKMRAAQLAFRSDPAKRADSDRRLALGRTESARAKMAETRKSQPGRPMPPETRAKISVALKGLRR